MVQPLLFLAVMLALAGFSWATYKVHQGVRRSALRRLAGEWQMRFVHEDRFDLTRRVAAQALPSGAMDVQVFNLIYCTQGDRYRYVFTVDYTLALDAGQRRQRRVMTVCEPIEHTPDTPLSSPATAPDDGSIAEQYEYLKSRDWCA